MYTFEAVSVLSLKHCGAHLRCHLPIFESFFLVKKVQNDLHMVRHMMLGGDQGCELLKAMGLAFGCTTASQPPSEAMFGIAAEFAQNFRSEKRTAILQCRRHLNCKFVSPAKHYMAPIGAFFCTSVSPINGH